jgi:hypothetical protein
MAELTVTDMLTYNTGYNITENTLTTDQADTLDISDVKDEKFVVLIANGSTTEGTATFAAGAYGDASVGDLEVTVPASGNVAVTLESARFKDSDGALGVTVSGATSGTIYAMELPY